MKPSPKSSNFSFHKPVLLQEALAFLEINAGQKYLDATLGGAGHTTEILKCGGQVLGLDRDASAIQLVQRQEALQPALASGQLRLIQGEFSQLEQIVMTVHWQPLSGVLFDLGFSSLQLEDPQRGFSFQTSGPLDMRLDQSQPLTAADLVNHFPASILSGIFQSWGDIAPAASLAAAVVKHRPYRTTSELARITGRWSRQAFLALRLAVNGELAQLEAVLPQALNCLAPKGRLVVISFHSLEDRLVKSRFRLWQTAKSGTILTPKPVRPTTAETKLNPRSKSARLRAFVKSP